MSATSVLVVDDDVWNAKLVAGVLEAAGYRVVLSHDPRAALPLLRVEPFSLVVLDQQMPGMDGLTLLAEIRKESRVPVVMLTASDRADLAVRALKLGAYDYLTKPLDPERLTAVASAALESAREEESRLGPYELGAEIGRGGMGVVYRAKDATLGREAAIKVLLPELAADRAYEDAFLKEARIAARFSHPNLVAVYGAGRSRGRLYLAMELVRGRTLESASLPPRAATEAAARAASALESVHEAGLVHGDLTPGNLMIPDGGGLKVLDFGLARTLAHLDAEVEAGSGTLPYAPPEVLCRGKADVRGDEYSLGVVLYELLAGRRAFAAETQFQLVAKIVEGKVPLPWPELAARHPAETPVVRRMMATDPAERCPSMRAAREALDALLR